PLHRLATVLIGRHPVRSTGPLASLPGGLLFSDLACGRHPHLSGLNVSKAAQSQCGANVRLWPLVRSCRVRFWRGLFPRLPKDYTFILTRLVLCPTRPIEIARLDFTQKG